MTQRDERIFDLDALVQGKQLPVVKLFGREIRVHPLNGASLLKLSQLDEKNTDQGSMITIMYEIAEQILPDLTHDEVLKMAPEQVGMISSIAQRKIEHVRKMLEEFEKPDPQ